MPLPNHNIARSREPVRVGAFERTLAAFNEEMSVKVALLIQKYDELHLAPVRARIQWLETPLWRRAWIISRDWWVAKFGKPENLVSERHPLMPTPAPVQAPTAPSPIVAP